MSLADMLNAPRVFTVGGVKLKARRVTLFDIYQAVSDALVAEGSKNKDQSLYDEVRKRIESGDVPPGCYVALIKAALKVDRPDISDADVGSLLTPNLMNESLGIVFHAIGSDSDVTDSGEDEKDAAPETGKTQPGKKKNKR